MASIHLSLLLCALHPSPLPQDSSGLARYAREMAGTQVPGVIALGSDVAARMVAIRPAAGYDSLHRVLTRRAQLWAEAEERFIAEIHGSSVTCRRGIDYPECGEWELRRSDRAQRLRQLSTAAQDQFGWAKKELRRRLTADGVKGVRW